MADRTDLSPELQRTVDREATRKAVHSIVAGIAGGDGRSAAVAAAGAFDAAGSMPMTPDAPNFMASITKVYTAVVVAALAIVVVACGADSALGPTSTSGPVGSLPPSTEGTPTSSGGPIVTDADVPRYVVPDVGEIQSVSPEGNLLVVSDGEQICVQPIDGPATRCVDWRPGAAGSAVQLVGGWSGDASKYVFFDRLTTARTFQTHVWMLQIESAELTLIHDGERTVAFDVAVDPGSDGFLLTGSVVGEDTGLLIGDGDRLHPLTSVDFDTIEPVADGSGVLASSIGSDEEAGVWWVGRGDGSLAQVLEPDPELGRVTLADVDRDGDWALVYYRELVARRGMPPDVSHFGLLEIETRTLTPAADEAAAPFVGPLVATLSADGQAVGYIHRTGTDRDALMVARRPTGQGSEEVILSDVFAEVGPPPTSDRFLFDLGLEPVWAPGGRMVLPTRGWALVLHSPAS